LAIGPAMNKRGVTTITITATDSTGTSMRSFGLRIGAAIRGDLNDDMTSDIVWRHSSGTLAIWLMNGTQVIGGGELTIVDPAWQIAGVGDFNADNHADLFWRHTNQTGFIWLFGPVSGGTGVIEGGPIQYLALNPLASWTGDFDGDGRDDLVL